MTTTTRPAWLAHGEELYAAQQKRVADAAARREAEVLERTDLNLAEWLRELGGLDKDAPIDVQRLSIYGYLDPVSVAELDGILFGMITSDKTQLYFVDDCPDCGRDFLTYATSYYGLASPEDRIPAWRREIAEVLSTEPHPSHHSCGKVPGDWNREQPETAVRLAALRQSLGVAADARDAVGHFIVGAVAAAGFITAVLYGAGVL
jgi:hypothetical protein